MSAQQPRQTKFGFSKTVTVPFEQALEKTRSALQTEGFGVLSEIDIQGKLKEKLGVDFRRYTILGACNPPLAYKALREELDLGLLLPCNVVVYEGEEAGETVVAAVDAGAMLSVAGGGETLREVSGEVNERLRRVLDMID
ncbi:MAG TPA: DUF302 domain-containing protein [Pyrinomonadaceae bacterium]